MSAHQAPALLHKLDALAREAGRVPPDAVLDILVELFAARGEGMSPAAREAALDLATVVMAQAGAQARGAALERLAQAPATPAARLLAWAAGPIETAGPALRLGRALCGAHLLRLLVAASPEHLRAAAERDGLGADVADLILLRGDADAIGRMLRNRSAALSAAGFSALAARALSDRELCASLVHRSDLPEAIVERLWPSLDVPLKARLVASGWRYSMSEVGEAGREHSAAVIGQVRAGALPQSVDTYATLVGAGRVTLDEALAEVLETGRLIEAAQLLARSLGLPEGVAFNLLYGAYGQGAAVLARRAELAEPVVLRIVAARSRLPWVRSTDVGRAVASTRAMRADEAAELLAKLAGLWEAGVANTGARRRFRTGALEG